MKNLIDFLNNHLILFAFMWFLSIFINGFIKAWTDDWLHHRKFDRVTREVNRNLKPSGHEYIKNGSNNDQYFKDLLNDRPKNP